MAGVQRSVRVSAETEVVIAECSEELFSEILHAHPACAVAVSVSLAKMVVDLTDRLFELAALDTRLRIYGELLRLMQRAEPTSEGLLISDAPTHAMIAATIGARREAVTREIGVLLKEGVLSRLSRRRLLVLDAEYIRQAMLRRSVRLVSHNGD